MKEIMQLLSEIRSISDKNDMQKRSTGGYFNIFEIAHINTKEVIMCRVIKEFIDVNGSHCLGNCFLKLFLKTVLHLDREFSDDELNSTIVEREKLIDNDRRIDLFVKIAELEIPIEAKIYAGDQNEQCRDYFKYAKNSPIYYLTLDGHLPSEESKKDLSDEDIYPISFHNEIKTWLEDSLKFVSVVKIAPIREVIVQMLATINTLTGEIDETMNNELKNVILSNSTNLKNAVLIQKALDYVHKELKFSVFKSLDAKITSKYATNRVINKNDYTTEKGNPGISYKLFDFSDNASLLLRVELEISTGLFFVGICAEKEGAICALKDVADVKKQDVILGNWKSSTWWLAWKYIDADIGQLPNFNEYNDAYFELTDKERFEDFVHTLMNSVDLLINELRTEYKIKLKV